MFRLVADHIHHVVHCDSPEQPVAVVHDRRGHQIQVFEHTRHIGTQCVGVYRADLAVHHIGNQHFGIVCEQPMQRHHTLIIAVAVDHEQLVGVLG